MIVLIKKNDNNEDDVLNYIGDKHYKSLYLYLNYMKYKNSDNKIIVFQQIINNEIKAILLIFDTTLHIFSKNNDYEVLEILDFIKKYNFHVICSDEETISTINKFVEDNTYNFSAGSTFKLEKMNKEFNFSKFSNVVVSEKKDYTNIVDFLLKDKEKRNIYSKELLYQQILNRNKEKYGRNYIIKSSGKIIAHAGTGAENEKIAVINLVMVDEDHRGKGYGSCIVGKLCFDLINENKVCYLMTLSKKVENLYIKIGFKKVGTYGKLVKM